jgi:hypothetical protein
MKKIPHYLTSACNPNLNFSDLVKKNSKIGEKKFSSVVFLSNLKKKDKLSKMFFQILKI